MDAVNSEIATDFGNVGIGLRQAVTRAREYMSIVYPEGLEDLQLEEVALTDAEDSWLVTFGFLRDEPPQRRGGFQLVPALVDKEKTRVYKIVDVDARTGKVKSMKIRQP